jgi:hypothetical protein
MSAPLIGLLGDVGGQILGAVGNAIGGTSGKGALVGGPVTQSGGGRITIKTTKGNLITIKRAKHRRYRGHRGGGMSSMMKQALQFKMLSQAMK